MTHSSYDTSPLDPALGLVGKVTEDPTGLKLESFINYETGGYRRRQTRFLPGGNGYGYEHYSQGANPTNGQVNVPCTVADDTTVHQGGLPWKAVNPPNGAGVSVVTESVYDALGRAVASRYGTRAAGVDTMEANWACTTFDARHRVVTSSVSAFGVQPVAFGQDTNGQSTSVSYVAGATTFATDTVTRSRSGRVLTNSLAWPGATTATASYTYDSGGRLTVATSDDRALAYGVRCDGLRVRDQPVEQQSQLADGDWHRGYDGVVLL